MTYNEILLNVLLWVSFYFFTNMLLYGYCCSYLHIDLTLLFNSRLHVGRIKLLLNLIRR